MRESNLKEIFLWILRLRRRYRVAGASMFPLLTAGDEVLIDPRAYRHQQPQIDDIVVAQHPIQADLQIIKRVTEIQENGRFHLQGDNPDPTESSDSRSFGPVPLNHILGRVTSRFG